MLETNRDDLVMISVLGEVSSPRAQADPLRVGHDGVARNLPGTGGITYNVKVGDRAMGWAGDHVEPGVTVKHSDVIINGGLQALACVGNVAKVVSGDSKGETGIVTGTHGGAEHLICYFAQAILEILAIGDKVQVKACGQGLVLKRHPAVKVKNLDPSLLDKMGLVEKEDVLEVPVTAVIPPQLMGSGIGATSERGDYDIVTNDAKQLDRFGLTGIRLGDIVAIQDHDGTIGRSYREGAITVGVVVHCDSFASGHGPGVTTLLTSASPAIRPVIDGNANIARYLGLFGG